MLLHAPHHYHTLHYARALHTYARRCCARLLRCRYVITISVLMRRLPPAVVRLHHCYYTRFPHLHYVYFAIHVYSFTLDLIRYISHGLPRCSTSRALLVNVGITVYGSATYTSTFLTLVTFVTFGCRARLLPPLHHTDTTTFTRRTRCSAISLRYR